MSCKETFPVFSQPHPWCGFLLESPPNTSPTTHNKSPFGRIFALRAKRAAIAHVTSAIAALSINSKPSKSTQKLSAAGFCPASPNRAASRSAARKIQKYPAQNPAAESSGRKREVWREREPPPKGGSLSLQGLLLSPSLTSSPGCSAARGQRRGGRWGSARRRLQSRRRRLKP